MGNDVNITVTGTNRTGGAFAGAQAGARGLADEVKKVNPELLKLDKQIKQNQQSIVMMSGAYRDGIRTMVTANADGTRSTTALTDVIKKQRGEVAELLRQRKELAAFLGEDTKSSAPRSVAAATIKAVTPKSGGNDKGILGFFASIAPEAAKAGAEAGNTFASAFQGGIMGVFKALPPEAQAALLAGLLTVAVVAAPAIASAVNAGILAGVGGGGLIAGIVLAARSPEVKSAYSSLGKDILADLTTAAKPFENELIGSASLMRGAFQSILPQLNTVFGALSQAVVPLVDGLMKAAIEAMPGIKAAALAAVPLFKDIAKELPAIGSALSSLLSQVADVEGSASGIFVGILKSIEIGLVGLGSWLNMMGKVAGGAQIVGDILFGWIPGMQDAAQTGHAVGQVFHDIGGAAKDMADSTDEADESVARLSETIDGLFGKLMGVDEATLKWNESMTRLKEELEDGKKTLNQHTKEGQENTRALLDSVDAAQAKYDADVRLNGVTRDNTLAFNENLDTIIAVAKAAGFNADQINELIKKYKQVPPAVETEIVTKGFGSAIAQATALKNEINAIPPFKTASLVLKTVRISDYTAGSAFEHGGIIGAAATGGLRSGYTMVGEAGPEVVQLPTGSKVYPHGQSMNMLGGGSDQPIRIALTLKGDGAQLVSVIRAEVFDRGGDVQLVLGSG